MCSKFIALFSIVISIPLFQCLAYNEWINATAQGSEAGEIVVTFSSQLMRGLDNEKNAIDRRIVSNNAQ